MEMGDVSLGLGLNRTRPPMIRYAYCDEMGVLFLLIRFVVFPDILFKLINRS